MSVTISITDPASTPREELQAVVTMLQRFLPPETGCENAGKYQATVSFAGDPDTIREAASQGAREVFGGFIPLKRDEAGHLSMVVPEEKVAVAEGASRVWYDETPPPSVAVDPGAEDRTVYSYQAAVPENRADEISAPAPATVFMGSTQVVPPPPPAEMPAFALTPPAPPAADPGGLLDKDGIPWDGRIHASTKTRTVENVWKKKRGVEQAEVDRVVAELRTMMMAPPPAVPAPPAAVAHAFATGAAAPVAPPAPPAPPAATGITFAEFMGHVTGGVTSGRFTRETVAEACAKHGAVNLPGLINRADLIPAVARELGLMA